MLLLASGVTFALQTLVLSVQFFVNRSYRGLGFWPLGFAAIAAGLVLIPARQVIHDVFWMRLISIMGANSLQVLGYVFVYLGAARFLERKTKSVVLTLVVSGFLLCFAFFTYIDDEVSARIAVHSVTSGLILLLAAWTFLTSREKFGFVSTRFNGILVFAASCLFMFRAGLATLGVQQVSQFTSTMSIAAVLLSGAAGFLLTMGLITMVNQRSYAQAVDAGRLSQSTVDALSEHIAILDETGTIIAVNAMWRSFAAANSSEADRLSVGANYLAVCDRSAAIGSEDAARASEGIRRVMSGELESFVMPYALHSATEERWFDMRVTRFTSAGSNRIVVAHENTTQRAKAENAMRDNAVRMQTVLNTVADGIITINEAGIIESTNRAAEVMFGYSAAELAGQNISMLMPEPIRSAHDGYLERYRTTGESRIIGTGREVTGLRKDGSVFPLDLAVSSMQISGQRYFVGTLRDIGDRKLSEALVQKVNRELEIRTKEAEQANRAKTEFLAHMSHEIRTPLNAVIGFADLLMDMERTAQQDEYLKIIASAGRNLLNVISAVMDFSKIEAGKLEINPVSCNLEEIIRDTGQMLFPAAMEKGITVRHDICKLPTVKADCIRLKQVMLNLAGNAVKFTDAGEVVMRAEVVREDVGEATIRFVVADTGMGISDERQAELFEPFVQIASRLTSPQAGTGLGLAISQRIVERMGGRIECRSRLGEGSTFTFELTFQKDLQNAESNQGDMAAGGPSGLRVLLVEDNPVNQMLASAMLSDHNVSVAEDGTLAIAALEKQTFDLVFLDLQLPGLDGLEVCRKIRDRDSRVMNHDVPVVAMTAYATKETYDQCVAAGMNGYLTKPLTREALAALLRSLTLVRSPE